MKTDDTLLTIGIVGAGAFILWNMQKAFQGIGSGVSLAAGGVGSGLGQTGQAVGDLATTTGKSLKNIQEDITYITRVTSEEAGDIIRGTGQIVESSQKNVWETIDAMRAGLRDTGYNIGGISSDVSGSLKNVSGGLKTISGQAVSSLQNITEMSFGIVGNIPKGVQTIALAGSKAATDTYKSLKQAETKVYSSASSGLKAIVAKVKAQAVKSKSVKK